MSQETNSAAVTREQIHKRQIEITGYKRSDGLWDIEGVLSDRKREGFVTQAGIHISGRPIHKMFLRLTIDRALNIVDAAAEIEHVPFVGHCERIAPDYAQLRGLTIGPGFRNRVLRLFGGVRGCTHVTELVMALATGAIQTMADQMDYPVDKPPFSLDGCHALDTTGEVVARYHARWYRDKDGA